MSLSVSRPEWISVTCDQCGAPLEVPAKVRFVTCTDCNSRLQICRHGRAVYTEVYEPGDGRRAGADSSLGPASSQQSRPASDQYRPAVVAWPGKRAEEPPSSAASEPKSPPVPTATASSAKSEDNASTMQQLSQAVGSLLPGMSKQDAEKKPPPAKTRDDASGDLAPLLQPGRLNRRRRTDALAFAAFFCLLWFGLSTSIGSPSLIFTIFWVGLGVILLSALMVGVWTSPRPPASTKRDKPERDNSENTTSTDALAESNEPSDHAAGSSTRLFPKKDN